MSESNNSLHGRVLIVAGSDSSGGAGIQADIKTVTALRGYAATAITAVTVQDTAGVSAIIDIAPGVVADQMRAVLDDIGADAIKIGMVHSAEIIEAIADVLDDTSRTIPIVVDPVMAAKGGAALIEYDASQAFRARLLLRTTLITPNIPEAEALTGFKIGSVEDMIHAAEMLVTYGAPAVLVTGGHGKGDTVTDVLVADAGTEQLKSLRIDTMHTHGTGCTLASAIATGLAQGLDLSAAVHRARAYVFEAIRTAPGLGRGHGPLNHTHTVGSFAG
jgi:hydroxymethylpyrimidine/phosphomethylpyrimidine kinase